MSEAIPTDFVAHRLMWSSPQRFVRNSADNWDQLRWSADGRWTFFDNHGDAAVEEYYKTADFVFERVMRTDQQPSEANGQ